MLTEEPHLMCDTENKSLAIESYIKISSDINTVKNTK